MTLPARPTQVSCANCAGAVWVRALLSSNQFGTPDLDLRPPPDARFTMEFWVERCPHCGYCAASVCKAPGVAPEFMQSAQYRQQLRETAHPDLANSFLCQSLIQEALGTLGTAARAALHAAWVCDDAVLEAEAARCRERATRLFDLAAARGIAVHGAPHLDLLVRIDLARRCREFTRALQLIDEALPDVDDPGVQAILQFQRRLSALPDHDRHTVAEAHGQSPQRGGDRA